MYLRSFNKSLTSSKSNDKIQQPIYTDTQDSFNKTKIKLTKKFVDAQDQGFKCNDVMQDNTSTIKSLSDGRESAGKRTMHLDMRLFYVKDLVKNKEVEVIHCPTEKMIAEHNTKSLVGTTFKMFRDVILKLSGTRHAQVGQQECVEQTRAQMTSR